MLSFHKGAANWRANIYRDWARVKPRLAGLGGRTRSKGCAQIECKKGGRQEKEKEERVCVCVVGGDKVFTAYLAVGSHHRVAGVVRGGLCVG